MNIENLPTEDDLDTPYAEGSLAFWARDSIGSNPYKLGTLSHQEWFTGFRDTRRAALRQYKHEVN